MDLAPEFQSSVFTFALCFQQPCFLNWFSYIQVYVCSYSQESNGHDSSAVSLKKNSSDFKDLHGNSMVGCFTSLSGTGLRLSGVCLTLLTTGCSGKNSFGKHKGPEMYSTVKEDKYAALDSRKPS